MGADEWVAVGLPKLEVGARLRTRLLDLTLLHHVVVTPHLRCATAAACRIALAALAGNGRRSDGRSVPLGGLADRGFELCAIARGLEHLLAHHPQLRRMRRVGEQRLTPHLRVVVGVQEADARPRRLPLRWV